MPFEHPPAPRTTIRDAAKRLDQLLEGITWTDGKAVNCTPGEPMTDEAIAYATATCPEVGDKLVALLYAVAEGEPGSVLQEAAAQVSEALLANAPAEDGDA